jgi:hypothetical protein
VTGFTVHEIIKLAIKVLLDGRNYMFIGAPLVQLFWGAALNCHFDKMYADDERYFIILAIWFTFNDLTFTTPVKRL